MFENTASVPRQVLEPALQSVTRSSERSVDFGKCGLRSPSSRFGWDMHLAGSVYAILKHLHGVGNITVPTLRRAN